MRVLMFGWEFPPYNQGGLGTACEGLSKALARNDVSVTFVLPGLPDEIHEHNLRVISADSRTVTILSPLGPYMTPESYHKRLSKVGKPSLYGEGLFEEVDRYAHQAKKIAENEEFDIIHAHDWLSFKAGIEAKKASGKPLVVHVHATEFDRAGGGVMGVNQQVYDREREGLHTADKIITVSKFTKDMVVKHYGVSAEKIEVVYNGITRKPAPPPILSPLRKNTLVLFLGRLTLQKGPYYFLKAAKQVLDFDKKFLFVMVGSGDMQAKLIEESARLGIGDKVLFPGFLRGEEVTKIYRMADIFVMPSVSEPFGIVPLEAINNGTPCIISKQSGVSEVVNHALKIDFWDVEKLASNIISLAKYKEARETMRKYAHQEINGLSWDKAALECKSIYQQVIPKIEAEVS